MKIKIINALIICSFLAGFSCAQHRLPEEIQERIAYCDSNFPTELIAPLRKEFEDLEAYFVKNGLLKDGSGESYHSVYERIYEANSFEFQSDITSKILDSLDKHTVRLCFFKLLTPDQLSQVTEHHLEVAKKVTSGFQGDVTMSIVAQRILEQFSPDDFQLDYFKYSSLFSFYLLSKPVPGLMTVLPQNQVDGATLEVLKIELDKNSRILMNGEDKTIHEVNEIAFSFLQVDPVMRAIQIKPDRGASYETYISLLEAVNEPISRLRASLAEETYGTSFSKLLEEQQKEIERKVPINIIVNEPKE